MDLGRGMGVNITKLELIMASVSLAILVLIMVAMPSLEGARHVSIAIRGLTTLSGILIAFIGFSLNHSYASFKGSESRKWIKSRIKVIALIILLSFVVFFFSYAAMVLYDNMELSFKTSAVGVALTMSMFFESIIILLKEEENE